MDSGVNNRYLDFMCLLYVVWSSIFAMPKTHFQCVVTGLMVHNVMHSLQSVYYSKAPGCTLTRYTYYLLRVAGTNAQVLTYHSYAVQLHSR